MSAFTGTWRLMRLALRRDRVKLPIWIVAIVGLLAAAVPTLKEVYGSSQQVINEYAGTMANSFVGRLFGGPIDGPYFGSIVMLEYFLFTAVLIIFMSTLAIVRHTRQNEETGRSELIGSGIVGRYAPLTAALLVVVGINLLVSILIALSLIEQGLPAGGSIAMAVGLGGVGIVFAAIAAVAAQVIGNARGTNAVIGGFIGLAVLLRGLGDSLGSVAPSGLEVNSAWPTWLSPIGWGQQMEPFSQTNWWIAGLFIGAFVALTGLAYWLTSHRDHGMGMIPARLGRGRARTSLLSPLGLAWRLQRTVLLGWGLGIVVLGVILGITAVEFEDFFKSNEQLAAFFQAAGSGNFTDIYFAAMMGFMAMIMAGYGLQAILRLQSEESAGHLEPVLATNVGRLKWALSHMGVVLFGVAALGALAGLSTALGYALTAGTWSEFGDLIVAGLVQIPAVLVFVGFGLTVFGVLARWSGALVWGIFAAALLIYQVGALLKLPEWLQKASPFAHTPPAPASNIDSSALWVMLIIAAALSVVGLVAFRRRDITTE